VECLLSRARDFMGSIMLPSEPFSIPQLVRYFPSQEYDLHTDFWPEHQITTDESTGEKVYFNRVASFFVFLRDNCTKGETFFPLVEPTNIAHLERMSKGKVARGEMDGEVKGVKFKPIRGNAVFWVNLDKEGKGDRRVVHAGLPVGDGEKIGLNIWPRKYFGSVDGGEEGVKKERKTWAGTWKQ
jgi:prolyl 4-hydroxylase